MAQLAHSMIPTRPCDGPFLFFTCRASSLSMAENPPLQWFKFIKYQNKCTHFSFGKKANILTNILHYTLLSSTADEDLQGPKDTLIQEVISCKAEADSLIVPNMQDFQI